MPGVERHQDFDGEELGRSVEDVKPRLREVRIERAGRGRGERCRVVEQGTDAVNPNRQLQQRGKKVVQREMVVRENNNGLTGANRRTRRIATRTIHTTELRGTRGM